MTDTRSPEQRRTDELSLAWVARRGGMTRDERLVHADIRRSRPSPTSNPAMDAYQDGYAAGLVGWASRGTEGMELHEQRCTAAQTAGLGDYWAMGHREGLALRAKEQEA